MSIRRSLAVATASGAVLLGLFATAEPVSAVSSCIASMSPKVPVGYSSLAVGCVIDISPTPSANATGLEVHDALNAAWHRGAARTATVTVTPGSATFTYASGAITTADIRRPISGTGIAGGAFIVTAGDTQVTAIGTRFDVRRMGDGARVTLVEGRVSVRETAQGDAGWSLNPGQQVVTAAPRPTACSGPWPLPSPATASALSPLRRGSGRRKRAFSPARWAHPG